MYFCLSGLSQTNKYILYLKHVYPYIEKHPYITRELFYSTKLDHGVAVSLIALFTLFKLSNPVVLSHSY